jgi:hypothetical protein
MRDDRPVQRRAVFLLLAAAACNGIIGLREPTVKDRPNDAGPGPFRAYASGTRLRAEVWDVDDVRALHGWFDAQRQEDCGFERHGEEKSPRYCFPTDVAEVTGSFADPACTQPAYVQFTNQGPPKSYLLMRPLSACTGPPSLYERGPALSAKQSYFAQGGTCMPGASANVTLYGLGDPVPLDALARAHEEVENRGGRIASLVLVTDDGAREVIGGYDQERKEPSSAQSAGSFGMSSARWLPARFAWHYAGHVTEYFSDPGCTRPVGAHYLPRVAVCPFTAVFGDPPVSAAGAPVDVGVVHTRDRDGGCSPPPPSSPSFGFLYVEVGAPIPESAFETQTTIQVGAGRIKLSFAGTDATGPIAFPPAMMDTTTLLTLFFDSAWGEACELKPTADGVTRCLPRRRGRSSTRMPAAPSSRCSSQPAATSRARRSSR